MNEDIIAQIRLLIEDKMGKYKKEINRDTALEFDLGITGSDASELLVEYGRRFNVDVSKFNMAVYFLPEGDSFLPALMRFFTGKKAMKQKELTVGDLEKGIMAGQLTEELLDN